MLTRQLKRRQSLLETVVLREFKGGWNAIDSALNLAPTYSTVMRNVERDLDGSVTVRQGTRKFATVDVLDDIVNQEYFSNAIISVDIHGRIAATNGLGASILIWDSAVASTLPGNPAGWSDCDFVSFANFRGDLIVCNGIDKPLIIASDLFVDYLQDLATGSNVNVPICRYVRTVARYLAMAGDPLEPDALYLSNIDSSGTWPSDAPPNDATKINLGSRVPAGSQDIRGIGVFRNNLVVDFAEAKLIGQLGVYDEDGNHTPNFDDPIEQHGTISHRAIQSLGEDLLACDIGGVNSIARALFTGSIQASRVSELIDPDIQRRINRLSSVAVIEERIFSIYDRQARKYVLFVPNAGSEEDISETIGYAYREVKSLKVNAWSEVRGWNWRCGCRSSEGRIFYTTGNTIFVVGNPTDPIYADFVGDQETWSDGTTFNDQTGFTPVADALDSGLPIPFTWELPWVDMRARMATKYSKHLAIDVEGSGLFNVAMYTDNLYQDYSDAGEAFSDDSIFDDETGWESDDITLLPTINMDFAGPTYAGYGAGPYGAMLYGSGRPTSDHRLYAWPSSFKIAKFRITGETSAPLKFVALSITFTRGGVYR